MDKKSKSLNLAYIALGTTLLTICSWLIIPMLVPITLQTFAVFMVLLLLGVKRGTVSIGLYILLGIVGIPVFSGFKAGIGALLGPTGGFILGFFLISLSYAIGLKIRNTRPVEVLSLAIGLLLCYVVGTIWFVKVYGGTDFKSALSICIFPFIIPDAIKLLLASLISSKLRRIIK